MHGAWIAINDLWGSYLGRPVALPACFHLAEDVFPRVRAETARRLVADGWSQTRAAAALGVSQAMVSRYVRQADDDGLVMRLADDLVASLDAGDSPDSHWCSTLAPASSQGDEALADLLAAERRLISAAPLSIMPQVGLNIARARPDATVVDDVLAYPARIVATDDRLLRPAAPSWGASRHLATCLLALRAHDPSLHAIANIRGGPAIAAAAAPNVTLGGEGDRLALFLAQARHVPRIVHDPGAIGYEPCLYIAGPSAHAVVDTILSIASKVQP